MCVCESATYQYNDTTYKLYVLTLLSYVITAQVHVALFQSQEKQPSIQMDHHVAYVCGSQKGLKGDINPRDHMINMIKGSFLEEQTYYRIILSLA